MVLVLEKYTTEIKCTSNWMSWRNTCYTYDWRHRTILYSHHFSIHALIIAMPAGVINDISFHRPSEVLFVCFSTITFLFILPHTFFFHTYIGLKQSNRKWRSLRKVIRTHIANHFVREIFKFSLIFNLFNHLYSMDCTGLCCFFPLKIHNLPKLLKDCCQEMENSLWWVCLKCGLPRPGRWLSRWNSLQQILLTWVPICRSHVKGQTVLWPPVTCLPHNQNVHTCKHIHM